MYVYVLHVMLYTLLFAELLAQLFDLIDFCDVVIVELK